jgi:non-ribosomal peptide synthetase-like protein
VVELCRLVPMMLTVAIGLGLVAGIEWALSTTGLLGGALLAGPLLLAAGALGGLICTVAKWSLVGRLRVVEHPLWSSFVWRNELADVFVEVVGATWLPHAATGAPMLNWWLRGLGAKIGRGVWLETYWLPEADLVSVGDGATVNRGCVLQTHLFHDRIMSMDSVALAVGASLGPHSILLPAARIGSHATVGPASLVMRGESVPADSRWTGNPIAPWVTPSPVSTCAGPEPAKAV